MQGLTEVTRGTPTAATLANLYAVIREVITDDKAYFTESQIKELKQDKTNIFMKGGQNEHRRTETVHSTTLSL